MSIASSRRDVERALLHGELLLHFQPKTELATGEVPGVEALARWQHPVRGLLGAEHVLPAVEAGGMLEPFTDWVLDTALAQRAVWAREGLDLSVAVNVSPSTVLAAGFADRVAAALEGHATGAPGLVIEVTEGALVLDHDAAAAVLGRLRTLGVDLSIDDFGTGWSSLARLRRLPFDEVKIDRSFVAGMGSDEDDRAIVSVVVDLARHFDRRVVAEGVEDAEQLAWLAALGCDLAQGFHLSPPVPAEEIGDWVREWRGTGEHQAGPRFPRRVPGSGRLAVRRLAVAGAGLDDGDAHDEEELLERLLQALDYDVAALWLVDDREHVLRNAALVHGDALRDDGFERQTRALSYRRGIGVPGEVWDTGVPEWLAGLRNAARFPRAGAAARAGLASGLIVPITRMGRTVGVLELYSCHEELYDERLLADVTAVCAGAFGEALTRAAERRAVAARDRAAAAVARAHDVLAGDPSPQAARDALCEALAEVTEATTVLLWEPHGDRLDVTASAGPDHGPLSVGLAGETSAVVAAYASRRSAFLGQLDRSPAASPRLRRVLGARSGLFLPVVRQGHPAAVVSITWDQPRRRPSGTVRHAIDGLLAHAAAVLGEA